MAFKETWLCSVKLHRRNSFHVDFLPLSFPISLPIYATFYLSCWCFFDTEEREAVWGPNLHQTLPTEHLS